MDITKQTAVLGGGCFWCLEALYCEIPGISSIMCGYAGGALTNPTYEQVCTGNTGHAEVIRIEFDPAQIRYEQILELFWQVHDPTMLNYQGADVGTQYRSVIFYENETQHQVAKTSRVRAQKNFSAPIVTEIVPLSVFYPAEESHQQFFSRNREHPYCQRVIEPKLGKFLIPMQKEDEAEN